MASRIRFRYADPGYRIDKSFCLKMILVNINVLLQEILDVFYVMCDLISFSFSTIFSPEIAALRCVKGKEKLKNGKDQDPNSDSDPDPHSKCFWHYVSGHQ